MGWLEGTASRACMLLGAALLLWHGAAVGAEFSIVNAQSPPCDGDERPIADAQMRAWGVQRAAPRAALAALSASLPDSHQLRSLTVAAGGWKAVVDTGEEQAQEAAARLAQAMTRKGAWAGATVAPADEPTRLFVDLAGRDVKLAPALARAAGCREVDEILVSLLQLSLAASTGMDWRWLSPAVVIDDGPARALRQRFAARLPWQQLDALLFAIESQPYQLRLAEFSVQAQGGSLEVTGTLALPFGRTSQAVRDAGFAARPAPAASRAPRRNPFQAAAVDPGRAGSDCERRARLWAALPTKPEFVFAGGTDDRPAASISLGRGFLVVERDQEIGDSGARLVRVGTRSSDVDVEYAEMTADTPPACVLRRMTLKRGLH